MIATPAFHRLSGAGNTFVMARADEAFDRFLGQKKISRSELAIRLCEKNRGVGVDGVLLLKPGTTEDFIWDFYNSDGSHAEMCGNAARCAGRFAHDVLGVDREKVVDFMTVAGRIHVRREGDGRYTVDMPVVTVNREKMVLVSEDGAFTGAWLNSGVPHFVIAVADLRELSAEICRRLRFHPDLGPAGANVTLLKATGMNDAEAVTYERGVEDFTAACGTGAVASANVLLKGSGRAHVRMPGGELDVAFGGERPLLTGPTLLLGKFEPDTEFFV